MDTSNPKKSVDLPPRGDRNADPITDAPGSHPIETGIGAAAAGAATMAAVGTVAGPVGTAVGAAVGAVVGGLAGKAVGEMIDPTTADTHLRDNYASRPYVREGDTYDTYVPAYQYGGEAEARYGDQPFETVQDSLRSDWAASDRGGLDWERAHGAVRDGYERSCALRKQRLVKP